MRLYLVRHGKAEEGPEEADRHLSERGRADIAAVAAYLAARNIPVARVLHSGLARARETAEILARELTPGAAIEEIKGIEPWGDVKAFAKTAHGWKQDTMVCGHEPFMGMAASLLLGGNAELLVKTGTVMAFDRGAFGHGWRLRWMLSPRIVRGTIDKP